MKLLRNFSLVFLLLFVGCLSAGAATYSTLTDYKVYCDDPAIRLGSEQEVTLRITNPNAIKRAFQFDVTLPTGLDPVSLGSSVGYCQSLTGAEVVSAWQSSTRTLRVVVTNASVVQAQSNAAFAKMKLKASPSFSGSLGFSNFIFALASNGTGYYGAGSEAVVTPQYDAVGITLSRDNVVLGLGGQCEVTATVYPLNASQKVTWRSSNTNVAEVVNTQTAPDAPATALIQAKGTGQATITATTADGTNLSATCNVQVNTLPPTTSLTLTPAAMEVATGDNVQMQFIVEPTNASTQLTWSSTNTDVATVSASGIVTGRSEGTATIVATTTDGTNLSATCQVTVKDRLATGIVLNTTSMSVEQGTSATLRATLQPSNASIKNVTWASTDTGVAIVDATGKVTGVAVGEADITATTTDGTNLTAVCHVTVTPILVKSITLSRSTLSLTLGTSSTLTATVWPASAANKAVVWTSSDTTVVKVGEQGQVTGAALGSAVVSAVATDGSNVSAHCQVTVLPVYATGLTLDKTATEIYVEFTDTLHASITPANATIQALTWSSGNTAVATVDEQGVVTAVAPGTATITAATTDGTNLRATCRVTVPAAQGNYLSAEPVTVVRGNEVIVPIAMINETKITGMQCELRLTGGIAVANDEYGDPDIYLGDRAADHELTCTQRQDFMQILAASITSQPFRSNMGTLFLIHLVADKNLEEGTFMLALRNITLSTTDGQRLKPADVEVTIGIEPYLRGDANGDNHVDVADFLTTANYILLKDPFPFYFRAADVDGNGAVDVNDLTGITSIALSKAPRIEMQDAGSETSEAALSGHATSSQLALGLQNEMALSALQFDMLLPEGIDVSDVVLTSRASDNHEVGWNVTPEGLTRVLVASPSAAAFSGATGNLMTVMLTGSAVGGGNAVMVTNVIASEPRSVRHELPDLTLAMGTTAIDDLLAYDGVRIYAENGNIVIESPAAGTAQLVQMSGIATPMRVQPGRNVYPMPAHGIAIVRIGGKAEKVVY